MKLLPLGDRGLVVEFGEDISIQLNSRVRGMLEALRCADLEGIVSLNPTYRSLLIEYDPLVLTMGSLQEHLAQLAEDLSQGMPPSPRVMEIPTLYGGEYGPDLSYISARNKLTEEEIVQIHSGRDYPIYMMGFAPGFPYLGEMDTRIAAPRLDIPRKRIPAGSVGIAGMQTGVYPIDSPGGWRIIGRTPLRLFDARRTPAVYYQAGDRLRFVPVDQVSYDAISRKVEQGTYPYIVGGDNRGNH